MRPHRGSARRQRPADTPGEGPREFADAAAHQVGCSREEEKGKGIPFLGIEGFTGNSTNTVLISRHYLAIVLVDGDFHTIQNECPHYFVDYREKLDDNPRYSDRVSPLTVNFSGNLFDFYFRVVSRMLSDVKMPFKLDERLLRVDDTPVHKALRECLANTLIHADYTGRQGVVIEKRFRHVTFANPGAFRIPLDVAIANVFISTRISMRDLQLPLYSLLEVFMRFTRGNAGRRITA